MREKERDMREVETTPFQDGTVIPTFEEVEEKMRSWGGISVGGGGDFIDIFRGPSWVCGVGQTQDGGFELHVL